MGIRNWPLGEEEAWDASLPLRQRQDEPQDRAQQRLLSEMTFEELESKQRELWVQHRKVAEPPMPEEAEFGAEEALAMDEESLQAIKAAEAREAGLRKGGASRVRYRDWRETLVREADEQKKLAAEPEAAEDEDQEWSKERIVASFKAWDITREDIDYMISLGKDDVGQAWEDLEIIAKAEMKMDGADPMDPSLEPHEMAVFERYPEVNVVAETELRPIREASNGKPFRGPAEMDIGGPGAKLSEVWGSANLEELRRTERAITDDLAMAQEQEKKGQPLRPRRCETPFVKGAEDFPDYMEGHTFEIFERKPGEAAGAAEESGPELWVRRIDDGDVRVDGGIDGDYIRHRFGGSFKNQRLLVDLDYGTDLFGGGEEMPWGLVVAHRKRVRSGFTSS